MPPLDIRVDIFANLEGKILIGSFIMRALSADKLGHIEEGVDNCGGESSRPDRAQSRIIIW